MIPADEEKIPGLAGRGRDIRMITTWLGWERKGDMDDTSNG